MAEDDEKVYTPEVIRDEPFPGKLDVQQAVESGGLSTGAVSTPQKIRTSGYPRRTISRETIAQSFNTKTRKIMGEYQFTQNGALQIGDYKSGVSGDVRISPDGIVGRDKSGNTSFALDGDTGDATFRGTVEAADFQIVGGGIIGVTVDGLKTAGGFSNIQDAIDWVEAQGGGDVTIPAGTYDITEDIYIYSGVNLIGAGYNLTIFDLKQTNRMINIVDEENIRIEGIHFTNWRYSTRTIPGSPSTPGLINITESASPSIVTDNIFISKCKFSDNYNSTTYGVYGHYDVVAQEGDKVTVDNSIFDTSCGIFGSSLYMFIRNNVFLSMPVKSIRINTVGGEVTGNFFKSCEGAAVLGLDDISNTTFTNNRLIGHKSVGFQFEGGFEGCLISNNTGYGTTGSTDFIYLYSQSSNSIIANNYASGFLSDGIDLNSVDNTLIVGNTMVSSGAYGISIRAGSTNNVVHDNFLISNVSGGINDAGTTTNLADNVTI